MVAHLPGESALLQVVIDGVQLDVGQRLVVDALGAAALAAAVAAR